MEEKKLWYVVNAYSGHEQKVKDGVKKEKVRKMFPGYVLIEMIMSDEAWYVVRNTPGVTGFIGSSGKGAKPIPLSPEEVKKFIADEEEMAKPINTNVEVGDTVTIIDGPFKGMYGKIESEDKENE